MKFYLILPIICSFQLLAMGDPTFLPANPELESSETKKDKKQMQQEPNKKQLTKGSKKKTKGDL